MILFGVSDLGNGMKLGQSVSARDLTGQIWATRSGDSIESRPVPSSCLSVRRFSSVSDRKPWCLEPEGSMLPAQHHDLGSTLRSPFAGNCTGQDYSVRRKESSYLAPRMQLTGISHDAISAPTHLDLIDRWSYDRVLVHLFEVTKATT